MPKRTTPYISQFFNRDKLAFNSLSKCGHVTHDQLKQCGLADARIKNYVRDGLIQKATHKESVRDGGAVRESYKLTKEGRELARSHWAINSPYHAQSPKHDLAIAAKYFSLSEAQRESFITEEEAKGLFLNKLEEIRASDKNLANKYEDMLNSGYISTPDAIYTNEAGQQVAFEVITNNYGKKELQAKEAFTFIMQTKYETTRV